METIFIVTVCDSFGILKSITFHFFKNADLDLHDTVIYKKYIWSFR